MADKTLTEAEWKKFAKGRDLKDVALLKALAVYEKAREPADLIEAIAAVEKETDALRKFVKGDKEFGAQLDAMDKAIAKEDKAAKAALREAESKESESEEDDGADVLSAKLIPLLRQVKKGDEMHALIAVGPKTLAVMLARRPISPSRRKLLTDHLKEGTPKFIVGTCIFEANAHTFVVQSQAAGLAKKLRAALFAQTDLRMKVRVRGEDPNDIDDDGEEAVAENEGLEADGPQTTQQTPPTAPPLPDPLKPQFEKRWVALEARVLAALKAGAGDVSKIRAVAEFVREKGEGGNYKAALQGADSLEKLLPADPPTETPHEGTDEAAAFNARLAALLGRAKPVIAEGGERGTDIKLRISEAGVFARKKEFERARALLDEAERLLGLGSGNAKHEETEAGEQEDEDDVPVRVPTRPLVPIWDAATDEVVKQTTAVVMSLRKIGDPELDRMADDMLDEVTELVAEISDALDDFEDMTAEARAASAKEAFALIRAQKKLIASSPLVEAADSNPLGVRATLAKTLTAALDEIAAAFQA